MHIVGVVHAGRVGAAGVDAQTGGFGVLLLHGVSFGLFETLFVWDVGPDACPSCPRMHLLLSACRHGHPVFWHTQAVLLFFSFCPSIKVEIN
jgi:hypothetical protein